MARMKLADMLRENLLSAELRCMLADLLDPRSESQRILNFSQRARGRRSTLERHIHITDIFERLREKGKTVAAAIEEIAASFGLDESTVKKAIRPLRQQKASPKDRGRK